MGHYRPGLAALLLTPVTFAIGTAGLFTGRAIVCVLYLGMITTGIAYWLFARGMRHLGQPRIGLIDVKRVPASPKRRL